MKHKSFRLASFKALDEAQGIFEAIVAAFNNVDRGGDRILPGAFKNSLAEWEQKGRPIPVIFAHEWDNLDAHIGQVLQAKEVEEGLYVRGQLEMDEPFAARVWKKMKSGLLAEFSFAYDVVKSGWITENERTVLELKELNLLEVGPCLVGMNPDTQLLGVKEGRRNNATDAKRIQAIHDAVCELGAKCAGADGDGEGEGDGNDEAGDPPKDGGKYGKSKDRAPSTLAARVALDLLEMGIES
jgi:hypothetical protein